MPVMAGLQIRVRFTREDRKKMIICGWRWAVGQILSEDGVDVGYTRVQDVYQSPLQKAQMAK